MSNALSNLVRAIIPKKTEFELAHEIAQRNAALPISKGGLGLPANNTAMDRAKVMGFDTPAYHGGSNQIEEFNAPINWFSENPKFASEFSNNQAVYPTLINTNGEFVAPNGEKTLKQWTKILTDAGIDLKDAKPVDWANDYGKYHFFDLFPHAGNNLEMIGDGGMVKAVGKKFKTVKSGREIENNIKSGKVTAVFDPSNIRSRFAAFDPMQRNSANILAGGALGAVGLGAMMAPNESKASEMPMEDRNALVLAAQRNAEFGHSGQPDYAPPRNYLAKMAQDIDRRKQIALAQAVATGQIPHDVAYGEEGLEAPNVHGISIDPTDYLGPGALKAGGLMGLGLIGSMKGTGRDVGESAMSRLIREAQAQIDAENATRNAVNFQPATNRTRNALIGIGAGGAGLAGGYYGTDYLTK